MKVEKGYRCGTVFNSTDKCVKSVCGNSKLETFEDCDDGNTYSGDGCSKTCSREAGWYCPNVGKPCSKTKCGNWITEPGEQCDDGNIYTHDHCTNHCLWNTACKDKTSPCDTSGWKLNNMIDDSY